MIVVRLNARSVAAVRLAPSPASEVLAWLKTVATGQSHPRFGDPGPCARAALSHPDIGLIATLLRGASGYVPDFLTPKPPAGPWERTLDRQLDVVRETPAEAVETQLLLGQYPGRRMPAAVRQEMEAGTFGRRAANGLHRFWRATLADDWRTLDTAITADLRRRAWTMATHGVGHVLEALHPKLRWTGDHLHINMRWDEESDLTDAELVLSPAILGWPRLKVQVCDPGNAVIVYPVNGEHRGTPLLASLVGATRARILTGLDAPSTTTQLSREHGLAPSTVSHHLSVLLGAGMVARARCGAVVHYERTERGDALVHGKPA